MRDGLPRTPRKGHAVLMPQLHLLVGGRVQGVGYRWFCRQRAEQHDVRGAVRNLTDGTVEVHAAGTRSALEAFRADVLAGPVHARVEPIMERWDEGEDSASGFRILA
ncbi:MAG: acylphosphatase [Candidatus Eisenbacteria bacterium]